MPIWLHTACHHDGKMIRNSTISRSAPWRSAAVVLGLLLRTTGGTAQKKVPVTGFFTNMEYIKEAGDVVGMEVWIVYARGSYWATVQLAEGEPDPHTGCFSLATSTSLPELRTSK